MPLSEQEQRAFEELEKAFYRDDPLFSERVPSEIPVLSAQCRVWPSVVCFAMGLGVLLAFFLTTAAVLGIGGLLLTFVSVDALCTDSRRKIGAKASDLGRLRKRLTSTATDSA
ncbi:MAG: DUF3040 domain-containing protein [Acidimicrobiales bacterium]